MLVPFVMGVLLFSWPLLSITADRGGAPFFAYLFITWAVLIAVLFLMTREPGRGGHAEKGR